MYIHDKITPGIKLIKEDKYDVIWFKLAWDHIWTKTRGKIWDDAHIQSFTNDELLRVAEKAGFEVEKSKKFLLGMLQAVRVQKK